MGTTTRKSPSAIYGLTPASVLSSSQAGPLSLTILDALTHAMDQGVPPTAIFPTRLWVRSIYAMCSTARVSTTDKSLLCPGAIHWDKCLTTDTPANSVLDCKPTRATKPPCEAAVLCFTSNVLFTLRV